VRHGFLCGMGGGDFSSYMPSTSIFFPKRLQGTAMGIQAGLGNFGVSIVQFVAPWIIGLAALGTVAGGPQVFTKADPVKGALTVTKEGGVVRQVVVNKPELAAAIEIVREGEAVKDVVLRGAGAVQPIKADVKKGADGRITEVTPTQGYALDVKRNPAGAITDVTLRSVVKKPMWLQNAAFVWVPFLLLAFVLSVLFLRSLQLPTRGFMGQFEILSSRNRARTHTWNCTITYICSFGSFSGFSAAFPMLIKTLYGGFDGAPDPLAYAYIGPLIGGLVRMLSGGFFDRIGGSKGMHWTTLGQIAGVAFLVFLPGLRRLPHAQRCGPVRRLPLGHVVDLPDVGHQQRGHLPPVPHRLRLLAGQGRPDAGLDRGAWAAFGPFVWNVLIALSLEKTGAVTAFFVGCAVFYVYSLFVNWWYYTRRGAERFDYGNSGGTWWDQLGEADKERMKRIDL